MLQTLTTYFTIFSIVAYGFLFLFGRSSRAIRGLTSLAIGAVLIGVTSQLVANNAWVVGGLCIAGVILIVFVLKLLQFVMHIVFGKAVADHTLSGLILHFLTGRRHY